MLPSYLREVVDATDGDRWHTATWPVGGLECARDLPRGEGGIFYPPPGTVLLWAAVVDDAGPWLRMSWHLDVAPCLGIWADNGMFSDESVVALEPTTRLLRRPVVCLRERPRPDGGAGTALRWSVEVTVGEGV
jgi:hypothetical protein